MFCPGCGLQEERIVQFCRACGTELNLMRSVVQPDQDARSLASAREEIARAVAARIQQGESWQVGALVSELEKIFESPEGRRLRLLREDEATRLRRLRAGVITAASGLGTILLLLLVSIFKPDALILAGPGLVALLIGLGIVLNGLFFTRKQSLRESPDRDRALETDEFAAAAIGSEVGPDTQRSLSSASVTDHTTRHLSSELANLPGRNGV